MGINKTITSISVNIKDAEVSNIFKKCRAGVLVEPNNVETLINGFDDLLSKNLIELGLLGRGFVVENFDRKKQSENLLEIIGEL